MDIIDYYIVAFKKYADFSGRASRAEYWSFTIMNLVLLASILISSAIIVGIDENSAIPTTISGALILTAFIYILIAFIPSISVTVRRMHDVGLSGWIVVACLVPIIGSFATLATTVISLVPGNPGSNQYGPPPKQGIDSDLSIGKNQTPMLKG